MKLFGTDGIRGRAGEFPLDPASVRRLGETLGRLLAGTAARRVVLGGDTRESTSSLIAELAAGLSAAGCPTAFAGTLTTPGVAEVVLGIHAAAGISVSASHNPFEDNGIKIFGPDGRKLADSEEERIEGELLAAHGTEGGRGRGGEGRSLKSPPLPLPHSPPLLSPPLPLPHSPPPLPLPRSPSLIQGWQRCISPAWRSTSRCSLTI
jgi:phosphomannomutase